MTSLVTEADSAHLERDFVASTVGSWAAIPLAELTKWTHDYNAAECDERPLALFAQQVLDRALSKECTSLQSKTPEEQHVLRKGVGRRITGEFIPA